ncbi:AAA family ATPase [Paenibacillus sp. LMG 31456]|uniref:AAA family ATPase n=1 Tax=Paenibacillus foliorum TaxID=2654974 RepID=A0A972K1D2_9BACL|nr:ATP-binding protein [Paenibacillus foliorum]NOU93773.1 AAA family ATPase [Paenibacillus foliorum]
MESIKERISYLRGADVVASYRKAEIAKYRENPLIEALQPIHDVPVVIKKLTKKVAFHDRDRSRNPTLRLHCIYDLPRLVQPLENHLRIEQSISILIRDGYVDRNPLTVNGVRIRNEAAENVSKAMEAFKEARLTSQSISFDKKSYKTSGGGLSIIGVSGMGKTTAINNILMTMYPAQVIRHGQYKGQSITSTQIVWLKLECPPKGSIRGLCLNFFQILKDLVGDDHYDIFVKRGTVDQMIPTMAQLCATYMIGVLIIDEIQHLSGNTDEEEHMLNFFVTLKNMLGVPIVLIGTNKAWEMLSKEFRQLRRACEHFGVLFWERMDYGSLDAPVDSEVGLEWKLFLGALWKYQWTRQPVELNEVLNQVMYEYSQGVTDIAIKLFMIAQWRAINSHVESLTPQIIRDVFENELSALKPVLLALKLNEYAKLEALKDIYIKDFKIDKFFNSALAELAKKELKAGKAAKEINSKMDSVDISYEATKWLMEAQVPANHAEIIVRSLIEENKNIILPELKSLALQAYAKIKVKVEKRQRVEVKNIDKKKVSQLNFDIKEDVLAAGSL